ncbi:class I SAM-dependent methyltransferase [Saccharibacillus sp. VR-M41]|uniref:Class I SAM-dependent methyltransferase n=1 Tax=Saccharibacillus alkalitolerans TaxID=2705290 RepID=A0ABX0F6Q3_9BACL|nr:class I SAM-dependent methyltransferase [Saccharibacillus alkalitolerans]
MKIGQVELNLDYYKGYDAYSDGDIEDEILSYVENEADLADIIRKDDRWPILYHLSPIRRNLLEWIEFDHTQVGLEVGAGCGALTGVLCEGSLKVDAIELSLKRAKILAGRNKDKDNLNVLVGNFNDIPLADQAYDYITLIGVLEYAAHYTNTANPFQDFLNNLYSKLKPNGRLIVAIENKFGLKYWSGAREDHTGEFFDGLENYKPDSNARTFSKSELDTLLQQCGFDHCEFYYPYPDYKMPKQIFSDDYLPDASFGGETPNYDMDRVRLFNEKKVLNNVIQNEMFPFFSNSFLVICQKGAD